MSGRSKIDLLRSRGIEPRQAQIIDRNTLRYQAGGATVIQLHDTAIMRTDAKGRITLNTGGWKTVTTKDRLNHFMPAGWSVFSARGQWYLRTPAGEFPFADGLTIRRNGQPIKSTLPKQSTIDREKHLLERFMAKAKQMGVPAIADSQGDPWIFAAGPRYRVDRDIMLDWLKTGYVTRRIYELAMEYDGMQPMGVELFMRDAPGGTFASMRLQRLRRYIRACLGHAQ